MNDNEKNMNQEDDFDFNFDALGTEDDASDTSNVSEEISDDQDDFSVPNIVFDDELPVNSTRTQSFQGTYASDLSGESLEEVMPEDLQQDLGDEINQGENIFYVGIQYKNRNMDVTFAYDTASALLMGFGDYVRVDIKFNNWNSSEIRRVWAFLQEYEKIINNAIMSNEVIDEPIFIMTITPSKYLGRYTVTGVNPFMWALTAENPGEVANTIRIMFMPEHLVGHEVGLDMEKEDAELERKINEEIGTLEAQGINDELRDEQMNYFETYSGWGEKTAKRAEEEEQKINDYQQRGYSIGSISRQKNAEANMMDDGDL